MRQTLRGKIGRSNVFKRSSRGGRLLTNNERLLGSVLALLSFFGIVLPEVSNSHRGGHPPLPPPSSLRNLKITEVGEGEGGATSFGEKVGDGGGSTAATSFLWSHF